MDKFTDNFSDIDEVGVTANFGGEAFKVAPYCTRNRAGPKDVGQVAWDPASGRSDEMEAWPSLLSGRKMGGGKARSGPEAGVGASG